MGPPWARAEAASTCPMAPSSRSVTRRWRPRATARLPISAGSTATTRPRWPKSAARSRRCRAMSAGSKPALELHCSIGRCRGSRTQTCHHGSRNRKEEACPVSLRASGRGSNIGQFSAEKPVAPWVSSQWKSTPLGLYGLSPNLEFVVAPELVDDDRADPGYQEYADDDVAEDAKVVIDGTDRAPEPAAVGQPQLIADEV